MLHPAHVLPPGTVAGGAGMSGQFVTAARTSTRVADPEQAFVEQAATHASLTSGVAPFVSARAGIQGNNEGGLTYTGRTVRVDARHAFGTDTLAFSVGAGASAVFLGPGSHSTDTGETAGRLTGDASDSSASGFGFDIPVLVGWRSSPAVVQAWAGARVGMERARAAFPLTTGTDSASVTGTRWYGGGLVGFAVGLEPVWAAFELEAAYQTVQVGADFPGGSGTPGHRDATLSAVTIVPAGALVGRF